jgi:hypothetical protein
MDIGAVIKAPFEDQDWVKKMLLMGVVNLLICFTVIGIFVGLPNILGWGKAYAQNRLNGRSDLPEFGFGYIGEGYRVILAMLPLVGVFLVLAIVVGGVSVVASKIASILSLVVSLIGMIAYLVVAIAALPLYYRHIVHDDPWAGARIGWSLNFIKENTGAVVMYVVVQLVIGVIAGVMGIVPILGAMFGMAFQAAAGGAAVAELARVTNRA